MIKVETLNEIHEFFKQHLKENGTEIDAIYYCPHRPDENCACRKPKPGLLIKASDEYNIEFEKSYFVGDSDSDMQAANSVNCNGILLINNKLIDIVKNHLK